MAVDWEKVYSDYHWNLECARYWHTQIGKHPKAKWYWQSHLQTAQKINDRSKRKYLAASVWLPVVYLLVAARKQRGSIKK